MIAPWLILTGMCGVLAIMAGLAALMIYVVGSAATAWADADKVGCAVHFGDIVTAYYRFRDGSAITRARTKLWSNGIRMSFDQVERLAESRKPLERRVDEIIAQHRADTKNRSESGSK